MIKKLFPIYKIQFGISLALFLVILALKILRDPFDIVFLLSGCLLGTLVLDLEYVIYAYFLEPQKDFSKTIIAFLKHGDLGTAAQYIYFHKDEITDKSLNSAIFQIVIGAMSIFVATAGVSFFIKGLVLSIFANTIYKLSEHYFENKTDEWFWTFKSKPKKQGVMLFTISMIGVFIYCLSII
jgi:hypothetical protein